MLIDINDEMVSDKIKRLENRADYAELDIEQLLEDNRKLSMRLRRFEVKENHRNSEIKRQDSVNSVLALLIGLLTVFILWGHGIIDYVVQAGLSLF